MLSCTLLCRRSATTTWNRLISRFLEDAITGQLFLNSCFNHICSPLEFNSTKIHQHSTNWTRWNKNDEFWNNVNSLFKRRFLYRRRRCFLRLGATKVYSFFPCLFTLQEVFIQSYEKSGLKGFIVLNLRSGPILAVFIHSLLRLPLNVIYKAKRKLSLISSYIVLG